MKADELKLRVVNEANELVDLYFSEDTFVDKMTNTTLKILINQNKDKLNDMFSLFQDKNGEIDAEGIINQYAELMTDDGVKFDLKHYIKNDFIRDMLPNKFLIINKEDILKIVKHGSIENV